MSWRSATFSILVLIAACGSTEHQQPPQTSDVRAALTHDELLDPTKCMDCHPKHYKEWSSSMHAYATKDPVFLAMNKRGQEKTNGALGKFCVNCHAPMAVATDAITDFSKLETLPDHLQGVTCYFCHNAVDTGPEHFNGNVKIANDNIMRGALDHALIPSVHKVQYSVNHDRDHAESAQMCGTCHDIVNNFMGHNFPLEQTFTEWQQTFFAKTTTGGFQSCQTCHMDDQNDELPVALSTGYPGVFSPKRKPHEHLFPGVDVALTPWPYPEAMQSAVEECQLRTNVQFLDVVIEPPTAMFSVRFETLAGHQQPSGATQDRRMWMEVVGKDDSGKVIYQEGQIKDGEVEEPPGTNHRCMMRDYMLDDAGNETHNFWEGAKKDTTRAGLPIPLPMTLQAGTHTRTCSFRPPGLEPIPHLELTLKMRPIGIDVLQDLVATGHLDPAIVAKMPTHTVWTRKADWNADSRRYLVDQAHPDCDKYKCMLDPSSSHCTPGAGPAAAMPGAAAGAGAAQLPASAGAAGAP